MIIPRRFSLVAALGVLAACTVSAKAATHSYQVSSFSKLRVAGPFDVRVHVGGNAAVMATGNQRMIDRLSIEQQGDTLVVKPLPGGWGGWPMADNGKLVIDIVAPELTAAALAGSGNVSVDRVKGEALELSLAGSGDLGVTAIDVTRLTAQQTGSGDLTIAGHALQANVALTGSGDFHGDKLAAEDASVNLIGSGNMSLGARHTAKVSLAGSGDIDIGGPATCTINRAGSGDVRCAHQATY
jgi:Putative auto-transporter adhesin, head GIN domain